METSARLTIFEPDAVMILSTWLQASCISGEVRQISPKVWGLITLAAQWAPAMASWIIDMWVGNMNGSCHSVCEYAHTPTAGTWYCLRSSWIDALDQVE